MKASEMMDLLESAWGLIANAHNGDWESATKEWQEAAIKWRDKYHAMISEMITEREEGKDGR